MRCIHCQYPLFIILPHLNQQKKRQQQMRTDNLLRLSTNGPAGIFRHRRNILSSVHLKTKALTSSLVLGINSSTSATSGDLAILIPTTAGLLFVYWLANFVVPDIILKDLQDRKPNDDDTME